MKRFNTLCVVALCGWWAVACGGEEATVEGPSSAGDVSKDSAVADSLAGEDSGGPGDTSTGPLDSGSATLDAGLSPTDAAAVDAAPPDPDTAVVEPDTATDDVAPDAAVEPDAAADANEDTGPKPDCVTDDECADKVVLAMCLAAKCLKNKCTVGLAQDGEPCDDDDNCTGEDACKLGQCVGTKPLCGCKSDAACDDNEACTKDTCDGATGKCVNTLTVGAPCEGTDPCTEAHTCQADGTCGGGQPKGCDDANPCTDDACDKANGCVYTPNTANCSDGNLCFNGGKCADGACQGGEALKCDDANPCTDDACDPATGKCVAKPNAAACDDGKACTGADACKDGTCAGTPITCDDANPCTTDACDANTGKCASQPVDGGCDDGNPCTATDTCAAGKCVGSGLKDCGDDNPCTDDACDKTNGCTHTPNAAGCSDTLSCKSGQCKDGKCALSDVQGCDDNNVCTTDVCDKDKGCVYTPVADGGACDDGNKCTEKEACKAGKCTGASVTDCDDDNPCTTDACDPKTGCSWVANTAACEDGDKCTKGDKCASGKCNAGAKIDPKVECDDSNPCTLDQCDANLGCTHPANTGACDDGNKCTVKDVCTGGKCQGTSEGVCVDGGPCKTANCDPASGACAWSAKTGACDDGSKCTTGDTCKNGNCVAGTTVDCDDKNACTADKCDPNTGACSHAPNSDPCDDGQACTNGDACVAGKCQGAVTDCSDGDPCTKDSCDAASGKCLNVKEADCKGCTKAADCDDGNPCTTNACDDFSGKCSSTFNTGTCDNGDPCTYGDKCDGKGKCITGTASSCDDDNPCTADACDKATGKCAHTAAADGGACDDGKACTSGDACKAGVCVPKDDKCDLYFEPFDCPWNNSQKGWTLQSGQGNGAVGWAIDETPKVTMTGKGCNLNYNDGTDYCQVIYGNYCYTPNHYARTPYINAAAATGTPRLKLWSWIDVDTGNSDQPRVRIDAGNQTLYNINLDKTKMKQWVEVDVPVANVKGHNNIRILFYLNNASGQNGNAGQGWFIDDLRLTNGGPPPEICDDGKDNDGDGKVDCADGDCMGTDACKEQCSDGKDNDLDDKVDCDDPDCAGENNCKCLLLDCDDKSACTTDSCDPLTAKCVHTFNQAPCDDGKACTKGDTCGDGNCIGSELDCGDGNPCTTDSCDAATGTCKNVAIQGCGGCKTDAGCDDGNACTTDKCDVATGKCSATPNTSPCDSGDLCTWGDVCDGKGSCVAGKNPTCDDGNACTSDKCDPQTGKCGFYDLADGTSCSDGKACTTGDACKAGVCTPTKADCPLYKETFDCPWDNQAKGWLLQAGQGNNALKWAVDDAPKVTQEGKGCNLNYNDNTDYCQPQGSGCQTPNHAAYSPVIDASAVQGEPHLKFTTWYDLDAGNNTDVPRITVYAGNQTLYNITLDKNLMKQWRNIDVAVPNIKGRNNVRLRLQLNPASGWNGNAGQGWFVDDLEITNPGSAQVPPEVCDDGKDNDGDGKVDCLDIDCKAAPACQENCSDGKDNDFDDKIDCLDPDCSADAACQPPLVSAMMNCGDGGWTFSPPKNGVTFAIDGTPSTVAPNSGSCTMNFNNGTNFCGVTSCSSDDANNRTAGTATLNQTIDATGLKELWAEFWSYQWGQDPAGMGAYYDVGLLQVSTDNFNGCCNGSSVCSQWSQDYCNTAGTMSFMADKSTTAWKKWVKVKVDLKDMIGKKFQLRLRFTSRTQVDNNLPGWFVDDLKVYGGK